MLPVADSCQWQRWWRHPGEWLGCLYSGLLAFSGFPNSKQRAYSHYGKQQPGMAKRKAAAAAAAENGSKQQQGKQQRKQQDADDRGPSTSAPAAVVAAPTGTQAGFKNKEKVLLLGSRGITYR